MTTGRLKIVLLVVTAMLVAVTISIYVPMPSGPVTARATVDAPTSIQQRTRDLWPITSLVATYVAPYTCGVPRLIHLNGPPAIGKSTLAQRYADEHPGVLNLDVDQVRSMIGGWRSRFAEAGAMARPIAIAMASTHLENGHDVIFPQYLGDLDEITRFESAATSVGAEFVEIMLMDTKAGALARFAERTAAAEIPWHRDVHEIVEANGGTALLADMYDLLDDVIRSRRHATVLTSAPGRPDETYAAIENLLNA